MEEEDRECMQYKQKKVKRKDDHSKGLQSSVKVAYLGSPSLTTHTVSVDMKQHRRERDQRSGAVRKLVNILGSPAPIVLMVSVDVYNVGLVAVV